MGYKVLSKKEICPNQYEMQIEAPYVVRNAKAGQFIIFRVEQDGERVPLTVADVDKEKGILTIVFMAVGYTTKKLAMLNAGDELVDIVGPLGKPTDIKKYGTVVCIAGGYGYATEDGTLMTNQFTYDWEGNFCYMQGNGTILR